MKKIPNTLGDVSVGTIIQGMVYDAKLKVLSKSIAKGFDDAYAYECEYIDGFDKGDTETIYSFMSYKEVKNV